MTNAAYAQAATVGQVLRDSVHAQHDKDHHASAPESQNRPDKPEPAPVQFG
jgi:hypothetical protein